MTAVEHAVYATAERCYRGHQPVYRLEPALQGWIHYCPECQAMVATATELERSQAEPLAEGVIGRVVAWPLSEPLRIEPWQNGRH